LPSLVLTRYNPPQRALKRVKRVQTQRNATRSSRSGNRPLDRCCTL